MKNLFTPIKSGSKKKSKRVKNKVPALSVVMPCYNAEKYLASAINSVMKQTFRDFEFIIIDDASEDSSWEIIQKFAKRYPKKIRAYQNDRNIKQALTVNRALDLARADFIARMDADDIALPDRFAKQLDYLNLHKKTVAVGSQCLVIDSKGKITGEKHFPTSFEDIYKYIFKFCPAQQPTFMIAKKRLPRDFQFYNHNLSPVEDVELLFKLFKYGRVENMSDYLLLYRIHDNNSSLKSFRKSFFLTLLSRIRGVAFHDYKPSFEGIIYTAAQILAVSFLPKKTNENLYKFFKSFVDQSNIPQRSYRRVAYQLSKAI